MSELVMKLVYGDQVTDEDIAQELCDICENEHATCNDRCPVYEKNGGAVDDEFKSNGGCDCFKDGKAMLAFLRGE